MRDEIIEKINTSNNIIDLVEMEITDEEIEEIANSIVENKPHVQDILLGGNYLSDKGATILKRILCNLKNLFYLEIQENQIDLEGILTLNKLTYFNPKLEIAIGGNKFTNSKVFDEIRRDVFKPERSSMKP